MNIVDCCFQSHGTGCAGTLMLPDSSVPPPVIVMAHGFGNIRTARLPAFAERFVMAGYSAFLFDYRTFGDSDGEPRHLVHPGQQLDDWRAAIDYVRSRPDVDSERMILWGTSFSGGHVLKLASERDDFAAVISQMPHVSGPATSAMPHPLTIVKSTLAGLLDLAGSLVGRPYYRPIAGRPGECAGVTGDAALDGYWTMIPDDANWENKILSRSFLYVPFYSPRNEARRVTAPTLMIAAARDSVVPASAARRAARRIPDSRFHLLECNHFEPYFGDVFEKNIALQVEFLRTHAPVEQSTT